MCNHLISDAAGVAANARGMDYLFVDTAGRLHTKHNLMQELQKLHRVMGRQLPGAQPRTTVMQSCLTAEKWKKMFSDMQQNKDCHFTDQKITSTGMSGDLTCKSGDGRTNSTGHVEVSFVSDEKMTGKAHMETTSASMPKPIVMDMTFDSVYQGSDCKGISPDSPKIVH